MANSNPVFKKNFRKFTYERPTHFLSVKVNSETIKKNLLSIVDNINKVHPSLESCIIDQREYHITLFVLTLKTEEDYNKAIELLSSFSSQNLKEYLLEKESFDLNFKGIGNFADCSVIWSGIEDNDSKQKFCKMVDDLRNHFKSNFPECLEKKEKPFTPHLTLAKRITKDNFVRKRLGDICNLHKETIFGNDIFTHIELLKMKKMDGYYIKDAELKMMPFELKVFNNFPLKEKPDYEERKKKQMYS